MALTFTPSEQETQKCPEFSLNAIWPVENRKYTRADFFKGKASVFMFICNHCPYVKAIENRLIQLGHELKKRNVELVAVCSNDPRANAEDSFSALQARSQEKNYSFIYLHDPDQTAAHAFGAVCTPDFFVYNSSGEIYYRGRLDDSWKDEALVKRQELLEAVDRLLKGEPPSADSKASMGCSIKWSES